MDELIDKLIAAKVEVHIMPDGEAYKLVRLVREPVYETTACRMSSENALIEAVLAATQAGWLKPEEIQ